MAQKGNWAEAGQVVKRRDYTAAFLVNATLFGVRRPGVALVRLEISDTPPKQSDAGSSHSRAHSKVFLEARAQFLAFNKRRREVGTRNL